MKGRQTSDGVKLFCGEDDEALGGHGAKNAGFGWVLLAHWSRALEA